MRKNKQKESEKTVVNENFTIPSELTILPLRDIVIFPFMIYPVLIGRASSIQAITEAMDKDKFIFLTAQKDPTIDEPDFSDIYEYGTTAKILQVVKLPNNLLKVLVEGLYHSKIVEPIKRDDYLIARIVPIQVSYDENDTELKALIRRAGELFYNYVRSHRLLSPDVYSAYENIKDPIRKLYFAAANIHQSVQVKQKILEKTTLKEQYFELNSILTSELEILKIEEEIDSKVQSQLQKTQKKYYIQEQIRALQKELEEEEEAIPEIAQLKEAIEKAQMPEHAYKKAIEELERLKKTPTMSPEYSVNRTYLEWLVSLPWSTRTEDNFSIEHVKKILDEDHYDLEKPKERILEYIAVLNVAGSLKRQILCFVGPPGVGKTSLARSIARALGRKFVRFSLGGVRDEAEIRGHRRTYVGAMPGKIIQAMKKAGTINPVILLDEIDKMSMDFRGDPSAALLEVLDPEQNVSFQDHYIEVEYDLSNVLFITTANVKYEIPLPLLDRMEIIELSSYLEPEKLEIAKRHIIPKIKEEFGISDLKIDITDEAIIKVIREYTREAGVRNLERELSSIFRKKIKDIIIEFERKENLDPESDFKQALRENPKFKKFIQRKKFLINVKEVEDYLKVPKYKAKKEDLEPKVGVAVGLAWTSVGGDIMPIEVAIMPGQEKLTLTGQLGDVMKESAKAALSFIRANYQELKVPKDFFHRKEIHIHVPEGAIPKDGPSAGITIAMALISAASGNPVRGDVAMTGEITLRGNILPIGGLNEKLLAAKRAGINTVIIPYENEPDLVEVNDYVKKGLNIIPVKHLSEALPYVFVNWNKNSNNKGKNDGKTKTASRRTR
ncbi:MAG: ATP-dependent protease La Type I [Candidatus Kapaibacterium sp.]|nr:MAG: ATP-dependent protease La Type I [Candidatus Kapabacteria bacterium]